MDFVVEKILWQTINVFTGAVITCLWAKLRQSKKENNALKAGVQALLRDRIIQAYNHYTEKGWMPIYARDSLNACYNSYEALGENGVIDDLMKQLRALPNHEMEG